MKAYRWFSLFVVAALLVGALGVLPSKDVAAQVSMTSNFLYTQNFDGLGTNAVATLPTNWRVDKNTTVRSIGTWGAAASATEQRAGNNMSPTAANGIYNYAAGDPTSATDRALGWISSSSATKSGNAYLHLQNDTGADLNSVWISYDVEKYRMGTNTAGFSIQMYYSTNGTAWTSAGASFLTSFAGSDASNSGYNPAPGATASVSGKLLSLPTPIANGGSLYLAWNYAVTSGTTTSNAQGLGIDNVVVSQNAHTYHTVAFNGSVDTSTEWDSDSELLGSISSANYYLTWDSTYLYAAITGGDVANDKYNLLIDIDPNDTGAANSGTTTQFCGATFGADSKPDYAIQKYPGGVARVDGTGGSWAAWTPAGSTDAASTPNQVEFKVQWSDIGVNLRTSPVAVYLYTCNSSDRVWSAWPPMNPQWTGNVQELPARTYLPTTDGSRLPRTYGQHKADQTQFNANGSFSLLNGFAQVNITSGGGAGCEFRVDVRANAPADVNDSSVRRIYWITPTGCSPTADITLKYLDGTGGMNEVNELNGHIEADLKLFRYATGIGWVDEGGTVDTGANTVTKNGVSTFSPWTFDTLTGPTAITLTDFTARSAMNTALLASLALIMLGVGAAALRRRM